MRTGIGSNPGMNILVSNDDGIFAPGLAALVRAVSDLGHVTVVAPDSPQSAAAHSITLRRALTVRRVEVGGDEPFEGMAVDGRPADCVRLAVRYLLPVRPDLVLSGINAGANVGVNVFYSGTVAAAAEGAMCGVPAVAFSLALADFSPDAEGDYPAAARHCRAVLDALRADGFEPGELVNVNIPVLAGDLAPRGVRASEQSDADVVDTYRAVDSPEGIERYRLADEYEFSDPHDESDVALLRDGYITVIPLRTDMTDHDRLGTIRKTIRDNTTTPTD